MEMFASDKHCSNFCRLRLIINVMILNHSDLCIQESPITSSLTQHFVGLIRVITAFTKKNETFLWMHKAVIDFFP